MYITNSKTRIRYLKLKDLLPYEQLYELLWKQNETYRTIATMFKVNEHSISKLAKEYNIPKNWKSIKVNANKYHELNLDINEIIYLYCEKECSLRAIAKVYNCLHPAIAWRLREENIEIRPFDYYKYYECRRKFKLSDSPYVSRIYRLIMGRIKQRPLKSYEHVHHRDFNRKNNEPSNLFLFENGDLHLLYHGFCRKYGFIIPEKFLEYYERELKCTYDN